jgi:hypothetical protein
MMRVSGLKRIAAAAAGALLFVVVAASPSAATVLVHESVTGVTATGPLPCANGGLGEDVTFTISIHVLLASTVTGRRASLTIHADHRGTGVGAITGDVYRFAATSNVHQIVDLATGQQVVTLTVHSHENGPGPDNNLKLTAVGRTTTAPDGNITVDFERISVTCD